MSWHSTGTRRTCPGCWRPDIALIGNGLMARHHGTKGVKFVCPASGKPWTEPATVGSEQRPCTATNSPGERAFAHCMCSGCEEVGVCTPSADYYEIGGDLLCEACHRKLVVEPVMAGPS